jgi:predicted metalloprotease with PDZ domain
MSKENRLIFAAAFVFVLILQFSYTLSAQAIEAKIKIETTSPTIIEVQGVNLDANSQKNVKNFSFTQTYAGIENLAERVSDIDLLDEKKSRIGFKKLVAGEFLAEKPFHFWNYKVKAGISANYAAMSRISWISGEQGILMTGDLLPQFITKNNEKIRAKISFELPQGWKIASSEKKTGENAFEVSDIEKAVFYVGKNWREQEITVGNSKLNFIISGERQFSDAEAFQMASEIFGFYEKLFGAIPNQKAHIFLGKFPIEAKYGRWEAETRGASVTIFSAEMPFKTQSLQRLHEQLRHEIFHLWMPNKLNLSGNYDWFYEGFALYQALKTGVAVNRLRFEDFLDTLSRAHDIDTLQSQRTSLIEASKNRWNGANTQIYARGMLAAFLCDITVLRVSKGKTSLTDIFQQIYRAHRQPNPRQEGNSAILEILQTRQEIRPIIEKYIKGAENIAWQTDLEWIGIESAEENFQTKLKVRAKPNNRQKDLLDKLGYNNWRKLTESSR